MPPYIKIIQEKAFNFLILLPEKEDGKKKTEKETAIDMKKKGIALPLFPSSYYIQGCLLHDV